MRRPRRPLGWNWTTSGCISKGLRRVVAFAGLDRQALLLGGQMNVAVAAVAIRQVGRVAEAVLVPQVLFDLLIDLLERLLLRNLEEAAAGFGRDLLQNFLPVG